MNEYIFQHKSPSIITNDINKGFKHALYCGLMWTGFVFLTISQKCMLKTIAEEEM